MKKTMLITGANGFIGKNLVDYFNNIYDVSTLSRTGDEINNLKIDLTDEKQVEKNKDLISTFDVVIHCAANSNPKLDEQNYNQIFRDNVESTHNLVRCLNKNQSLVFMSSILVYNENGKEYPQNIYGITKYSCEQIINYYSKQIEFSYCNFRLSACVGEKYTTHGMLHDFLNRAKNNNSKDFNVLGTYPGAIKPYVHINDVCKNIDLICSIMTLYNFYVGYTFDLFPTDYLSVEDIAKVILKEFSLDKEIVFSNNDYKGDQKKLQINPNNLTLLKYTSRQAIEKVVRAYLLLKEEKNEN